MSYTVIAAPRYPTLAEVDQREFQFVTVAGFISDDSERACAFTDKADAIEYRDKLRNGRKGGEYVFEILNCLF
jgi:hypothetical protein